MSRYCQDCLGDCCCPSLEAEVERLRAEVEAAFTAGFELGWDADGTPLTIKRECEIAWSDYQRAREGRDER